jgi:hypothetical protein
MDALDFAILAVLSQEGAEGILHPVAYYSHKPLLSGINYMLIYDLLYRLKDLA